jgi:hypothetical protein
VGAIHGLEGGACVVKEAAHHRRAFEVFYSMGAKRSLAALAKRLNVSHASVKLWSRTFGWTQRIAERDESVAALVEKKATRSEVDRRSRNKQIVEAGIITAGRAIAEGKMTPTLSDLDRMIRLDLFLQGEADTPGDMKIVIEWPSTCLPPGTLSGQEAQNVNESEPTAEPKPEHRVRAEDADFEELDGNDTH